MTFQISEDGGVLLALPSPAGGEAHLGEYLLTLHEAPSSILEPHKPGIRCSPIDLTIREMKTEGSGDHDPSSATQLV